MPMATPLSAPAAPISNGAGVVGQLQEGKAVKNGSLADVEAGHNNNNTAVEREQPRYTTTSYPSNCLRFLQDVSPLQTHEETPKQSKVKLNILVVGAGLGGLATAIALRRRGHEVTVFEQAPELMEVGAGIQVPPNSGRLLARWGVTRHFSEHAVRPARMNFRRWADGALLGVTETSPAFAAQYGAPYHVVHRAHLHGALWARAVGELGVRARLGSRVAAYDAEAGAVVLDDGGVFRGDLVVAADGVKSLARPLVSPSERGVPKPSGYAVYRATVEVEKMRQFPELAWILEKHNLNLWIGENRHVMTYSIAGGKSFNMVLSHPDKGDPSRYGLEEDILGDMRREFEGWDEQLTTIIGLIDKVMKTPLMSGAALDRWVAPSHKLVILGDAAHAMVPYMSQGAAMAVEDGAALAAVLDRMSSITPGSNSSTPGAQAGSGSSTTKELAFALRVFERERVRRSSMMQEASLVNAMIWHFGDGPLQRARDAAMRAEVEGRHFLSSPNQWSDPVTQNWAYGYDAEGAVGEAWDEAVHELIMRL